MRLVYDGDQTFIGTHRDYVLWRFFGQVAKWLPFEDAGLRANLFTAFWGALTVGAISGFVYLVTRSFLAALASACALAVSHTFWLLSVIAEVYTFNAGLVFIAYFCVAAWWQKGVVQYLWLAAAFAGLSLLHHPTGLVLAGSVLPLMFIRARGIGLRDGAITAFIFLAVSLLYWIHTVPKIGFNTNLLSALGLKMSQNPFFDASPLREAFKFSAYLSFNFIGVALVIGVIGFYFAARKRMLVVVPPLIWSAAFVYAGITSSIPDKFNVYVLVYPCFAILIGLGIFWLQKKYTFSTGVAVALLSVITLFPPAVYLAVAKASNVLMFDLVNARKAPLRDNAFYFIYPPKNNDFGPRIFAEQSLKDVPENGVLIADYTLWRPIYFMQSVENIRKDVQLVFVERLMKEGVSKWIEKQSCNKRIFLATNDPANYYQLEDIEQRYLVLPYGSVFEVIRQCN